MDDLPFIDEHSILVSASPDAVWRALAAHFAQRRPAVTRALAHLLGAQPRRAAGEVLALGATRPGFAVAEIEAGRRVRFTGGHHFSRYTLEFTLTPASAGTRLSARSHAAFPGRHGRAYRGLVIGCGVHDAVVRRMLRSIGRRAERVAGTGRAA